jgi:hypothetical protein
MNFTFTWILDKFGFQAKPDIFETPEVKKPDVKKPVAKKAPAKKTSRKKV